MPHIFLEQIPGWIVPVCLLMVTVTAAACAKLYESVCNAVGPERMVRAEKLIVGNGEKISKLTIMLETLIDGICTRPGPCESAPIEMGPMRENRRNKLS